MLCCSRGADAARVATAARPQEANGAVGVREGAYHLEQLGVVALWQTVRSGAPPAAEDLSDAGLHVERTLLIGAGVVYGAGQTCVPAREGPPAYLPRMAIGKNKKLSKGRKGRKKKLCARPAPPLNRFSLLRSARHGLIFSMDILDTRARWGAQRGPVLAQGVVRRQGAVHLRRPQCREDVREPDAGDTPAPSARYRGWLSSESSPRSKIAFVSDV
eukprot:COSAG04_NODE_513_length_13214_cov_17.630576_5_plen_216_part_00